MRVSALVPAALLLWLVPAAVPMSAAGAPPQPDAAPQAPAVAPDPVPEAPDTAPAPPEQPAPAAPAPPAAAAPSEQPSVTEPEPAPPPAAAPPVAKQPRPARERRRPPAPQEAEAATASPDPLLRVDAILPSGESRGDSPSGLLLLAAGALLALILASGSLVSVASRVSRGALR